MKNTKKERFHDMEWKHIWIVTSSQEPEGEDFLTLETQV